jgi:hypothetical protein
MQNSYTLTGYVLRDWKTKIETASQCELDDVEVFLEDLRHHSRTSPASGAGFFDRLEGLSVGPLRAFVSGSCLVHELDTVLPMFFKEEIGLSSWQTSFDIVGEDVLTSSGSATLRV